MAGRPPLRIGAHGKITRTDLGGGIWLARCRFRDLDGITRPVERRTPAGIRDEYGAAAEDALLDAIGQRQPPGAGDLTTSTVIADLLDRYIVRLRDENELAPKSIDTYEATLTTVRPRFAGVQVSEAKPGLLSSILTGIRRDHGATRERHTKVALNAVLTDAVLAGVIGANPVRELGRARRTQRKATTKGAPALDQAQVLRAYKRVRTSAYCRRADLRDPVLVLMATGIRRSELLGLRWSDVDLEGATLTVAGRIVRLKGQGLVWLENTKGGAVRTVPLPQFAVDVLRDREHSSAEWVFPSTAGTLRDADNMGKQWRGVRSSFGLDDVSSHSWRKTLATLIDDAGMSARVGADQLGHARPSMTQDVYMKRNVIHKEVANVMDRAVRISVE